MTSGDKQVIITDVYKRQLTIMPDTFGKFGYSAMFNKSINGFIFILLIRLIIIILVY